MSSNYKNYTEPTFLVKLQNTFLDVKFIYFSSASQTENQTQMEVGEFGSSLQRQLPLLRKSSHMNGLNVHLEVQILSLCIYRLYILSSIMNEV